MSGDTNGYDDIFVHDQQTHTTSRVSVASDGTQGNDSSERPSISADGRFVAFGSIADNLVSGDANGYHDIFVHDQQAGTTTIVSVASDGTQGNYHSSRLSISADGRFVAFDSGANNLVSGDTNDEYDVFVHDRQTGTTSRISVASDGTQANGSSYSPSISADGRFVAFHSFADNLVSGDFSFYSDVFVYDRQTGTITLISVASDGTQGIFDSWQPSISADGRYVAFESQASNLVSGDTNNRHDIFVHDQQTGTTTRVSVASDGIQRVAKHYSPTDRENQPHPKTDTSSGTKRHLVYLWPRLQHTTQMINKRTSTRVGPKAVVNTNAMKPRSWLKINAKVAVHPMKNYLFTILND